VNRQRRVGGVQNQLYDRFKAAMFSSDELQRLMGMKDRLKEKLAEIGGLVR
jgi:hypothetical protein